MKHLLVMFAVIAAGIPVTAFAESGQLIPGAKVRATTGEVTKTLEVDGERVAVPPRVVGKLVSIDHKWLSVAVRGQDEAVRVPVGAISKLEVARGRSRLKGAGVGLLVGAGLGAAVGWTTSDPNSFGGKELGAMAAGTYFGLGGLVAGAALGVGDKWESVEPGRVRVSLGPVQGGVGAQLTFGF